MEYKLKLKSQMTNYDRLIMTVETNNNVNHNNENTFNYILIFFIFLPFIWKTATKVFQYLVKAFERLSSPDLISEDKGRGKGGNDKNVKTISRSNEVYYNIINKKIKTIFKVIFYLFVLNLELPSYTSLLSEVQTNLERRYFSF